MKTWLSLLGCAAFCVANAQVEVDYAKYPDYSPVLKPEKSLGVHPTSLLRAKGVSNDVLPDHWNNAETIYFPPVFNQDGGSCGSASRIAYMFNLELNSLRGVNGSLPENQYPTHFTWLLTGQNSGKEEMAATTGVPNVPTYGGRTYSSIYGNASLDCYGTDYGWMQGYDKWFAAMHNRITRNANFPESVAVTSGRRALKRWLYNHNGDTDFHCGGIAGIGVASALTMKNIPNTPKNDEIGVSGMCYVGDWGAAVDHALTIVGYDDRIEFDLDGNGVYGEIGKDEVGAWIIVNSWGNWWANKGFIYCPYKKAVPTVGSTGYYMPEIYYARKNYRPLRTLKVKMAYNHRAAMRLGVGISQDLTAKEPEKLIFLDHFKFAGNLDVPMLGRWADGKIHDEPMEFGYDVTDLTASFDRRKPLKYFFFFETKEGDTGEGKVYNISLMDYEFDKDGIEIPFTSVGEDGVALQCCDKGMYITSIINGENLNAPVNLRYSDGSLVWEAPLPGTGEVKSYQIYKNGISLATVPGTELRYTLDDVSPAVYQVTALYGFGTDVFESDKSNTALFPSAGDGYVENYSLRLTNGGFTIPNVFREKQENATIEFLFRPTSLTGGNQQIGVDWGTFKMTATSAGALQVGWNSGNGDCIKSNNNVLKTGQWTHIALVVRGSTLSLYANGNLAGSVTSSTYSGLGGFESFGVGLNNGNRTGIQGYIDEFRYWNKARTPEQIKTYAYQEFVNPMSQDGLLAYYRMDYYDRNDTTYIHDAISGNDAPMWGQKSDITLTAVETPELKADFAFPEGPYYKNAAIQLENTSSTNAVQWSWNAPAAGIENLSMTNPILRFSSLGEHEITLSVTDGKGVTATTTKKITIVSGGEPVVAFHALETTVPAGERVAFVNDSVDDQCRYEWLMPGADIEKSSLTHAGATYSKAGTYTVTLRATNSAASTERQLQINVEAVAPKAAFEVNPRVVVKGEMLNLVDRSKYDPTEWNWTLYSPKHSMLLDVQNPLFSPTVPGEYTVTLNASNAIGANKCTEEKALIVCNADSKTGLNFTGAAQKVSFTGPFASSNASRFTIDYWLRPNKLTEKCNYMGVSEGTFQMFTDNKGAMTVYLKDKSIVSSDDFVKEGEWHHYAVSYTGGTVYFYRDGVKYDSKSISASYSPKWESEFTIGGDKGPINGMIDEFRVWGNALTVSKIQNYCNAPLENVEDLQTGIDKLQVYYNFNQNSGNCVDASGNGYTGYRSNFGPDGDAWGSSAGVFFLNFEGAASKNVTSKYLKNYTAPFANNGVNVIPGGSGKYELTDWRVSGSETSATGIVAKPHVNISKQGAFTMESGWSGFPSVSNCAAYQVVELPAGAYIFSCEQQEKFDYGSYLVAAKGDTIPSVENLDTDALGYTVIKDDNAMRFTLREPARVAIGTLFRFGGQSSTSIRSFKLESASVEMIEAENQEVGISRTEGKDKLKISVEVGGIQILGADGLLVRIVSADGVTIFNRRVCSSERISLSKGIYIVNGEKVIIR